MSRGKPRLDVLRQDLDAPFLEEFCLSQLHALQDATNLASQPDDSGLRANVKDHKMEYTKKLTEYA